ncbi:MAG: amidohydrolase family protein, partial [Betaproteobacteria bacterium]|nr:amidohydrolase family protein [Betaproteobacteria bacterium]
MFKYLFLIGISLVPVLAQAVDTILVNGKIATVDDRLSMVQAIAIEDRRVIATGSNEAIRKLATPSTRLIDLRGRTVIPGLIDNHSHWIRAAEHDELRFDGITTRAQALKLLTERVASRKPGEWIVVLGGWSEEQFKDEPRGFTRAELDRIAPNHPVALQVVYRHTYLNSAGLRAAKIDERTPDPQGGTIEKDAEGKPTGIVRGAGGVAYVAAQVPLKDRDAWLANTRRLVTHLNSLGITAWGDAGGRGMTAQHYEPYQVLADRDELNVRVFWTTIRQPVNP